MNSLGDIRYSHIFIADPFKAYFFLAKKCDISGSAILELDEYPWMMASLAESCRERGGDHRAVGPSQFNFGSTLRRAVSLGLAGCQPCRKKPTIPSLLEALLEGWCVSISISTSSLWTLQLAILAGLLNGLSLTFGFQLRSGGCLFTLI